MPTYEFRCPRGHEFEKFYRTIGSAEAQALCPECGEPAERVMSPAGFAFKGSGFYLTDYGKNAHRDKGPTESRTATSADGASDSSRSDAKADAPVTPAAASEAKPAPEPKKREAKATDAKPATPVKKSANE
ncbi:MAG TPA: FmdB family zinc ribbon protein [Gaiellaceae bacterium]|nr:FmdB family zinc ribbon protein [Gaiellaceae bacterium]